MGVKAGSIDAGTSTTTISALAGRPSCILFYGTNQTTYESAFAPTQGGGFFGVAGENDSGTIHNYCEWAILTTGRCSNLTQKCARAMTSAGSVTDTGKLLYEATVTAITDDSFTVTFSTTASGHRIHYLAIWDISPADVFPYERDCDGDPYYRDVGRDPAVWFALGQWRDTCHTFPKSTSATLWNGMSWGDIRDKASVSACAAQSVISGQFVSHAHTGIATMAGVADPFVLGSICTGVIEYSKTATPQEVKLTIPSFGCGGGYDWAFFQYSECLLGAVSKATLGAGAIDSETAVTMSSIPDVEAVVFNNYQVETQGASLLKPKRWGVGFATPDYQCCFAIDEDTGSMYQSESKSWASKTTTTTVSAGDVNFAPSSGDFGLRVKANAAGNGQIGFMGISTECTDWMPQIYRYVYPPPIHP